MNSLTTSAILLTLGAASVISLPAQDSGEPDRWTPELAIQVKQVRDVRPSPDGARTTFVVATAETEGEKSEWLSQIHLAANDGSNSFQLTSGEKGAWSPRWSPDGRWIAFLSARSGKPAVWRIRVDGGEAQKVTDEKGSIGSFAWSPTGDRIAFTMADPETEEEEKAAKEKRDARVVDEDLKMVGLYVVNVEEEGRKSKRLSDKIVSVSAGFSGSSFDWAPNGDSIAFSHQPTPLINDWTKSDISVVHLESGRVSVLANSPAAETQPTYSPDGRLIAFAASDDPPTWAFTATVHIARPRGGGRTPALAGTFDRQPGIIGWSSDGSQILVSETQGTANRLFALPRDGGAPTSWSPSDRTVDGPVQGKGGLHIGFVSQDFDSPPEAFVSSLAAFAPRQVSDVQDLPEVALGRTEIINWGSSEGMKIEGLLTYPTGYRPGQRVPLLVIVHGGPTGVFTRRFIAARGAYPIAAFASRGYAVLRCNPRGSSGYGKKFRYANYGDWGGGDYRDIMAGVDQVIEMGVADPDRLGVMGWSYGGYMTSWIITQTNRFKAASVGAGVTNLMSFTGTSDVPGFVPDYFSGEYWETFEEWRSHSAMFQVGGVKTPTLIQHGERDVRVPVSQGYEFYNALKRQNVPVKMVVYPRQPHGIREPKLQVDAMHRNLEWFDRWLMPPPETTSGKSSR